MGSCAVQVSSTRGLVSAWEAAQTATHLRPSDVRVSGTAGCEGGRGGRHGLEGARVSDAGDSSSSSSSSELSKDGKLTSALRGGERGTGERGGGRGGGEWAKRQGGGVCGNSRVRESVPLRYPCFDPTAVLNRKKAVLDHHHLLPDSPLSPESLSPATRVFETLRVLPAAFPKLGGGNHCSQRCVITHDVSRK